MIKCDKCKTLLTVLTIYENKAYCANCKAWIGFAKQEKLEEPNVKLDIKA